MTIEEGNKLVGQKAFLPIKEGLDVEVLIKDCRTSFGREDILIKPVAGKNLAWVSFSRLKFEKADSLEEVK